MSQQKLQDEVSAIKNKSKLFKNRFSKLLPQDFFTENFNFSPKKFKISSSTERDHLKEHSKIKLINDACLTKNSKQSFTNIRIKPSPQSKPIMVSLQKLNQHSKASDLNNLRLSHNTLKRENQNNLERKSQKIVKDSGLRTLRNKNVQNYCQLLKNKLNININIKQVEESRSKDKDNTVRIKQGSQMRDNRMINSQKRNRVLSQERSHSKNNSLQKQILKAIQLAEKKRKCYKIREIRQSSKQLSPSKLKKVQSNSEQHQNVAHEDANFVQMNFGFDGMLTFCGQSDSTLSPS